MESPGVAMAAFEHGPRVAARRQAHEDALLGAPARRNAVRVQVFLQLPVHHVGGQQQGQLAQFGEHAGSPMVTSGGASTTSISSASWRNFSGTLEAARFPVKRSTAACCSRMYCTLTAVITAMPLVQNLLDILPAFRVAAARRIIECQLVDQADLGMAAEDGGQVDGAIDRRG